MNLRSSVSNLKLGDLLEDTGLADSQAELKVTDFLLSTTAATVAFVVPVHNQEAIIAANLESISASATLPFELVIVADTCSDLSVANILSWINKRNINLLLVRIILVESETSLFETISDSVGIEISTAPFVIEVQADMHVTHIGFDSLMCGILDENPNIFLLSGRGTHPFDRLVYHRVHSRLVRIFDWFRLRTVARKGYFSESLLDWKLRGVAGRLGHLIEFPVLFSRSTCRVFIGQTIMRGPLAFRRELYNRTGGLDTRNFFLGNDDHDLAMRALDLHGLNSGYVSVSFDSPLENGSTRGERSPAIEIEFRRLQAEYSSRAAKDSYLFSNIERKRPRTFRSFAHQFERPTLHFSEKG
jgi:hypothetical protein